MEAFKYGIVHIFPEETFHGYILNDYSAVLCENSAASLLGMHPDVLKQHQTEIPSNIQEYLPPGFKMVFNTALVTAKNCPYEGQIIGCYDSYTIAGLIKAYALGEEEKVLNTEQLDIGLNCRHLFDNFLDTILNHFIRKACNFEDDLFEIVSNFEQDMELRQKVEELYNNLKKQYPDKYQELILEYVNKMYENALGKETVESLKEHKGKFTACIYIEEHKLKEKSISYLKKIAKTVKNSF